MSGFEIFGAIAAGLQIAEQACKIVGRIRRKLHDAEELAQLKSDCEKTTTLLDEHITHLSPGARAAAHHLRDRLKIVIQNIDSVAKQKWHVKLIHLLHVWNGKFKEDLSNVTDKFRTHLVIEANELLQKIELQQENLEYCFREGIEEVIERVDKVPDVVGELLRSELAELDLADKTACLGGIHDVLKQHLESLQNTEETTRAISEGVRRIENTVEATKLEVSEQRRILQEIHNAVTPVDVRSLLGTPAKDIRIPNPSELSDTRVTYRSYADFILRSGEFLREHDIWDGIRDVIRGMIELKRMGYQFSKYPGTTNLHIGYQYSLFQGKRLGIDPNNTFWTDQLGEFAAHCPGGKRWIFVLPPKRANKMISVISSNFVDFGYLNALKSMFTAFITSFRIDLPMGMDYYDETGRMSSQIFDCIKMSFPINKAPEVERIFHNVDRTLRKAPRCNSVERFVYISEQIPRGTLSTLADNGQPNSIGVRVQEQHTMRKLGIWSRLRAFVRYWWK